VGEDAASGLSVRRVRPDEGSALEATRLAALRDAPLAFASTYEAEAQRPDDEWADRARLGAEGVDRVTFFALLDGQIVGLVGGFRPDGAGAVVELVSMWTSPGSRRAGVGRALVGAVIDWARGRSATSVGLWVTQGNAPAERLYESMGFRATGERRSLPSDRSRLEVRLALDF
jgi:GNAT superfamily N-acetyltransferase